jgi:hypothetical protein
MRMRLFSAFVYIRNSPSSYEATIYFHDSRTLVSETAGYLYYPRVVRISLIMPSKVGAIDCLLAHFVSLCPPDSW